MDPPARRSCGRPSDDWSATAAPRPRSCGSRPRRRRSCKGPSPLALPARSECSFLNDRLFNIEQPARRVQPYNGSQQERARPAAFAARRSKSINRRRVPDQAGRALRRERPNAVTRFARQYARTARWWDRRSSSCPAPNSSSPSARPVSSARFPALNARPVEKLDEWLTRIENELGEYKARHPGKKVAPYAVNQICHASNDRLMKDMETCVKHQVPIIITSLRPPVRNRRGRAFLWRRGVS